MPVYEYECLQCSKKHEVIQRFSDTLLTTCPDCEGRVKKLISNTSFVLKGTGWYVTDYASPERKKAMEIEKGHTEKKSPEAKIESKKGPAEWKSPEKKTESRLEQKKESVEAK
ncbi:hypothetical protein M1N62_03355 [Thermodesulfovibrionales bacterium]|nr:hypothetical protein [Thermodesulfovibrionales bacterium]